MAAITKIYKRVDNFHMILFVRSPNSKPKKNSVFFLEKGKKLYRSEEQIKKKNQRKKKNQTQKKQKKKEIMNNNNFWDVWLI